MRQLLLFLAAFVIASPVSAGMRATYASKDQMGQQLQIEVADNGDLRISRHSNRQGYSLMIGNTIYTVEQKNGAWWVARAADEELALARVLMRPPAKTFALTDRKGRWRTEQKIEERGPVRVLGRVGIIYATKPWAPGAPWERVISTDPALAPIGRALARFRAANYALSSPHSAKTAAAMAAEMRILEKGTLLEFDEFRLVGAEVVAFDPKHFALPAQPRTIDQLIEEMATEYPLPPHPPPPEAH